VLNVIKFLVLITGLVCVVVSMKTPYGGLLVPVPPLAIGRMPVTPVVRGRPVQLVSVPDVGVPSNGVVRLALVVLTNVPVPLPT
jgi:hypothetical protein